jgi:hypothetical protein
MANWTNPLKWVAALGTGGLSLASDYIFESMTEKDPWEEGLAGIESMWGKTTGQGSAWDKHQSELQNEWAWRNFNEDNRRRDEDLARAEQWRTEDRDRQQQWRNEDIERESLTSRMGELKAAGLHPMLAAGGMGGGGGGGTPGVQSAPMTQSGGRVPRPTGSGDAMSPVDMAMMASQMKMDKAQMAAISAEAHKTMADARYTTSLAEDQEKRNLDYSEDRTWGRESQKKENDLKQKQINELQSKIESSKFSDKLSEEQANLIAQQVIEYKFKNGLQKLTGIQSNSSIFGRVANDIASFLSREAGGIKLTQEDIDKIVKEMFNY